jgi:type IV pilus assembly protein PilC
MPAFQYKAIDKTGMKSRGRIDAANEVDLELRLKRMGLDLITFRARRSRTGGGTSGQIQRRDLITFCYDMEQISRAGIPIIDALRDLRDSVADRKFREIISAMLEDIEGGKMLSQAMAGFPQVFSPVFVSLIRAGEQSGQLTEVFQNLGETLKWQDELASQTKRLLMYPALVLVVVAGVSLFLLLYLVPQVVSLLKTMGLALPLQTRMLIAVSSFVGATWWIFTLLFVVAAIALPIVLKANARAR